MIPSHSETRIFDLMRPARLLPLGLLLGTWLVLGAGFDSPSGEEPAESAPLEAPKLTPFVPLETRFDATVWVDPAAVAYFFAEPDDPATTTLQLTNVAFAIALPPAALAKKLPIPLVSIEGLHGEPVFLRPGLVEAVGVDRLDVPTNQDEEKRLYTTVWLGQRKQDSVWSREAPEAVLRRVLEARARPEPARP